MSKRPALLRHGDMSQPTARPSPEAPRLALVARAGHRAAAAARFLAAQLVASYSFGVCTSPTDTPATPS